MIIFFEHVITWWLLLFIPGGLAIPFVSKFFSSFFDSGYTFSKILGIMLVSYIMYVFATVHILPFTTVSLYGIVVIFAVGSILFAKRVHTAALLHKNWKIFVFEEILFLTALSFWSFIKGFQPDIHGLEKFMDFGFINSILRSTYFPPKDMWMAPLSINYYYFGHLMTAVLTKLSYLPSNITFNLMLATIFALCFTEGFSIGANLIYLFRESTHNTKYIIQNTIFAGLLTAFLLTFAGNLHTVYTLFTPYQNDNPVPPTQLAFSPKIFPNQYWYPNATRFIYHTIHEFPSYSFVVSDLHGHVLDIPAVLLMIAVLLIIFLQQNDSWKLKIGNSILLGSLTAVMYMTNAWDGLIYLGVSVVLVIYQHFKKKNNLRLTAYGLLTLICSFIIIGLPFSLFFKPFASQIGVNCAPQFLINIGHIGPIIFEQGYCQVSPLWQLAILWGFFFFWFVSFTAFLIRNYRKTKQLLPVDVFVCGMGALGFCLIIVPEFVYLKDIYTTYFRANTMFKLVYQSFMLLSLLSSYTIMRISSLKPQMPNLPKRILSLCYTLFAICLITLVMIYPYFAISSYFNNLKNFHGLDGTTYLKGISASDYSAVLWINAHIPNQPVLLEAQGDSYTDYERISSNTGLPTVFGWMVHEWLWRGTYDIVPPRVADVTNLYESTNINETKNLLRKYNVQYVFVGEMERTKYPKLDEQKFNELGTVAYTSGDVKIYKIF